MSSITYHYGGKEGLYLAAADHIARNIMEHLGPVLDAEADPAAMPPDNALTLLLTMLDRFAAMLINPASQAWAQFIIREQQHPTEAFERLYDGAMARVADTVITLIGRIRPDLGEFDRRTTAVLLWGQTIVLRAGRASVERFIERSLDDEETCRLLRQRLRANALSILDKKDPAP
jgi:AcrR family transcriptional regulator